MTVPPVPMPMGAGPDGGGSPHGRPPRPSAATGPAPAPPVPRPGHGIDPSSRALIANHGVLGFLPETELRILLGSSVSRTARRGEVIFRQDDPGTAVTLVLEGYVGLSHVLADGREVLLEIVGPGECFGEEAVLNGWPQPAEAAALSRCRLLTMNGQRFREVLHRGPGCLSAALRRVGEGLRKRTEQMVDALALPGPARLAKALLRLARLRASNPSADGESRLRLSQANLGLMTGLARESVNKHLGAWRAAGWIALSDRDIVLTNAAALARLSRG